MPRPETQRALCGRYGLIDKGVPALTRASRDFKAIMGRTPMTVRTNNADDCQEDKEQDDGGDASIVMMTASSQYLPKLESHLLLNLRD
jgi:hypothetical protein